MKKLLFIGFLGLCFSATGQQWSGSTSSDGNINRSGNVGIGIANPQAKLEVKKEGTLGGLWNPSNSFFTVSDMGSTSLIMDSNEIYGSSTLYIGSKSGEIVRFRTVSETSASDKMVIEANGNVGIGITEPLAQLHVSLGSQLRKTTIGLTVASADNSWIRDEWLTGSYGAAKWDQNKKKWVRPGGTYNDIGGIVFQDEGTYFLREQAGTKLEYTNSEFLQTSFMFAHMFTGNVGIGTNSPDSKLTVKGKIHAEEVKIDLSVPAPDYVFLKDYNLKTIEEVEDYIKKEGHLPNVPSAKTMQENGVELGIMNMKLLEKIEELTLYTIQQQKKIQEQEARLAKLEALLIDKQ